MHYREILLTLWIFTFSSIAEHCEVRKHINALEGEFFYLKPCIDSPQNRTEKWYKKSESLGLIELPFSNSSRITLRNKRLEFWPLELDDSGSYMFWIGNNTKELKLNVSRRSNHRCYSENIIHSRDWEYGQYLSIECDEEYENFTISTSLYKDCEKIKSDKSSIEKAAESEDHGYYTCVYILHHNGKPFNFTKTYNVTIKEGQSLIIPYLHGPNPEHIEVELGKDVRLNCSASGDIWSSLQWFFNNKTHPNAYETSSTTVKVGKNQNNMSTVLEIKNINEKNLNNPYIYCLINGKNQENKTFILLKKGEGCDIANHIFKRAMIITVFTSVAIVCLVILGIIYRVDLALFYRHYMRRDETLTDGKMYDAFVSYLKDCQPENGEAHTFAVEILPRVLEKHFGYKLCIFERDVVPGKAVVDEIHSLIEKSRRLIIVLSKSYMSNEVRYELESGLHEALVERKIKIILIKFASVSDFSFLPQSVELLKSHRVLKWKDDKSLSYNSRFWKNLLYLMPAKVVKPRRDESAESFLFFQDSELQKPKQMKEL